MSQQPPHRLAAAGYRQAGADETVRANRSWWDGAADSYLARHGDFLGDRFVWGPEGLDEADARLLGPPSELAGRRVLEVGCGAAQCSRWLTAQGADVAGVDLSITMLRRGNPRRPGAHLGAEFGAEFGAESGAESGAGAGPHPGLVQADARRLPFADGAFDLACSAYGAVPFVADPVVVMGEVARVLRPGARWVFAIGHPIRWAFPDDPSDAGLTATRSYFDRTPYVEEDAGGRVLYAEHHRTLGDRVRDLVRVGLVLEDLVEPEWPPHLQRVWGGWSPLRGRLLPGTAIFLTRKG